MKAAVRRVVRFWNWYWFSNIDPLPASACRVFLGILIVAVYVAFAGNWDRFFAADGIMSLGEADLNAQRVEDWWCLMRWTEGWMPVRIYWYIGIATAVAFTIGYKTRLATITLFILQSSLIHRTPHLVNGEDMIFRMMLLYGCFAGWGERLSVDAIIRRRRHGFTESTAKSSPSAVMIPAWPIRMMQINIALVYIISLPVKFAQDGDWLTGDALHWTIASDTWWVRGFLPELTYGFGGVLRKLLTWGTVFVEGGFPILVCFRRTRIPAVLSIAGLHIGIALFIPHVTLFTLSMVAVFFVYLPAESVERAFRIIGRTLSMLAIQRRPTEATQHC